MTRHAAHAALPRSGPRLLVAYVTCLALSLPLGTLCHELVGHGGATWLAGGTITELRVLGLELYPRVEWVGTGGYYGLLANENVPPAAEPWIGLAGSASTWLVALAATVALWLRRWTGWPRVALVCLSLWWIDLVTYLLPVFSLRRSIFFGGTYSEPYESAVALGLNGPAFLCVAIGLSALLVGALRWRLLADRPQTNEPPTLP